METLLGLGQKRLWAQREEGQDCSKDLRRRHHESINIYIYMLLDCGKTLTLPICRHLFFDAFVLHERNET